MSKTMVGHLRPLYVKCRFVSSKANPLRHYSNAIESSENNDSVVEKLLRDQKYEELVPSHWRPIFDTKEVLLVMPRQKWGNKRMTTIAANHMLSETKSLVNTLPYMQVVDTAVISTPDVTSKSLFGSGNLQLLKEKVRSNSRISAVVFALDMLNSVQISEMETELRVEVFDRYSIVLHIFRSQARTKEAKLQIALAEIPYIRNNLRSLQTSGRIRQTDLLRNVGGFGNTWIKTRKMLLDQREAKLKKSLEKVESNRELLRVNRQKRQFPVVAVVGYTNSGKTSLIRALTDDKRLVPRNQLFATLDVTVHWGRLPSGLKVLFADTIGFISHIPTSLIHAFKSTLSEISSADLIIHVCDVSHPFHQMQEETVHTTLKEIDIPEVLTSTMIEVANKTDLLDSSDQQFDNKLMISATSGSGVPQLAQLIEKCIVENTGRLEKVLRVTNGGPQYQWLYKNSAIIESNVDPEDCNYLMVKIYITIEVFEKFKHLFRQSYTEIK